MVGCGAGWRVVFDDSCTQSQSDVGDLVGWNLLVLQLDAVSKHLCQRHFSCFVGIDVLPIHAG